MIRFMSTTAASALCLLSYNVDARPLLFQITSPDAPDPSLERIYGFSFGPDNASFILDDHPTPSYVWDGAAFSVDNVRFVAMGRVGVGSVTFYNKAFKYFITGTGGGLAFNTGTDNFSLAEVPTDTQLYTGSEAQPFLHEGHYTAVIGSAFNHYVYLGHRFDLTITSVPEPTTWSMLISGFGLVGAVMRRRRRSTACA